MSKTTKTVNVYAKIGGSWGTGPRREVEMGDGDTPASIGKKVMKELGAEEATVTMTGSSVCVWESNPT